MDRPDGLLVVTNQRVVFLTKLDTIADDRLSLPLGCRGLDDGRVWFFVPAVRFSVLRIPFVFVRQATSTAARSSRRRRRSVSLPAASPPTGANRLANPAIARQWARTTNTTVQQERIMNLTPRERVRRALSYEPVDRLPTQVNYTVAMGEKLAAHFGVALADLPQRLGNHLVRLDLTFPKRLSEDGRTRYDWWGVGFDTEEEGYFPSVCPLAGSTDLDAFAWPDPANPHLLDDAARIIAADEGQHFIAPNFGFALFERAWLLRGFETFLADTALDPGFAGALLDRITEIQLVLIRRFIALGVDGGYFGDDYGAQKNMLFSPAAWRR